MKENLSFEPNKLTSPISKLMLSVMGAVAEFQRSLILERQREGSALPKAKGAYKGRVKKVTPELLDKARNLLASGQDTVTVSKELGVSRASLYRWFKEIGEPLCKKYNVKRLPWNLDNQDDLP